MSKLQFDPNSTQFDLKILNLAFHRFKDRFDFQNINFIKCKIMFLMLIKVIYLIVRHNLGYVSTHSNPYPNWLTWYEILSCVHISHGHLKFQRVTSLSLIIGFVDKTKSHQINLHLSGVDMDDWPLLINANIPSVNIWSHNIVYKNSFELILGSS